MVPASVPPSTQHKKQFTRSHAAVEVADEVANRRFCERSFRTLSEELPQLARKAHEEIPHGGLETRSQTDTADGQSTEDNTAVASLLLLALLLALLAKDARHEPIELLVVFILVVLLGGGAGVCLAARQHAEEVFFGAARVSLLEGRFLRVLGVRLYGCEDGFVGGCVGW
ncbi:hypothetical protein HG530_001675 [Fusarium avenaceum]|nr:hypothetical protein HG530_001675 [Fusarium avenaceum]